LHRYTFLPHLCTVLAPVHIFTTFVHSARTGTHFYHFYHGQSGSLLKDGRAEDLGVLGDLGFGFFGVQG